MLLIFLALPILIYFAYSNVLAKNIIIDDGAKSITENHEDNDVLSETTLDDVQNQQPGIETQNFTDIQLVSHSIDSSLVNSCIASET